MPQNDVAKTLRIIGIVEAICGVILGLIIMASGEGSVGVGIGVAVMVTSFITCMIFVGFAEVINLLQKNADIQEEIFNRLGDQSTKAGDAPKTVLQDIEDNLPDM